MGGTILSASSEIFQPSLFQPTDLVCGVSIAARAHVLSWYQQLMGNGPTFLLSQREGAPPTYGLGVNPRFLAEIDPAQNAAHLTMGNTLLMRALSTAPCGFQDSTLYLWRRHLSVLSG